jgi:hypothetical protein
LAAASGLLSRFIRNSRRREVRFMGISFACVSGGVMRRVGDRLRKSYGAAATPHIGD